MDTILVLGGAGYIGAHVCKQLKAAGFLPVTYDNLSTGHAYAVKWGPLVLGDLHDTPRLREAIRTHAPKGVIHLAASALVEESVRDPGLYYHNNVSGSIALLQILREEGISSLLFSSTCATYGQPLFTPITEAHPQNPISPYGKSKKMVEDILLDFERAYGLRTAILRYFNVAGADLHGEIGEHHTPETHLIPSVIQTALQERSELLVYGTDFPTKDGSAVRDYVHVVDLAKAHVAALQWILSEKKSLVVNLGTGVGASVLEIIEEVRQWSKKDIPVRFVERRSGDPARLTAEYSKAKELLGWTPSLSTLPLIIETAWKWHQALLDHSPALAVLRSSARKNLA